MLVNIEFSTRLKPINFCKYELTLGNRNILLSFPQLLQLRSKIKYYCTPQKLDEIIETDNFILLSVADKAHLLFLEIPQLLDLKDEVAVFFEDLNLGLF